MNAKMKLFEEYGIGRAIVNSSFRHTERILRAVANVYTVSDKDGADFKFKINRNEGFGVSFSLNGTEFKLPMGGSFNVINAALAIACA